MLITRKHTMYLPMILHQVGKRLLYRLYVSHLSIVQVTKSRKLQTHCYIHSVGEQINDGFSRFTRELNEVTFPIERLSKENICKLKQKKLVRPLIEPVDAQQVFGPAHLAPIT